MSDALHPALLKTAEKVIRPVVRLLLGHGVGHHAMTELCRRVFVEESELLLVRKQQRPTVSAISGMTGLSRKEVARLQSDDAEDLTEVSRRRHRVVQCISGWVNDPEFQADGHAGVLPLQGSTGSFAQLVRRYGGDVTPSALLTLLSDSGNVRVSDDRVELVTEAYLPMATPLERLEIFGTDGAELLQTIEHNLFADSGERRFQRKVSTTRLDPKALNDFKALNEHASMELLERFDSWLAQHESPEHSDSAVYVAVGIYLYEQVEKDVL